MTPSAFVLAAMLSLPWLGHPSDVRREHHRVGPWSLTVIHQSFAGRTQCRLDAPGVDYVRGAVELHLSPRADTFDAVYRIDGGPPRSVRADALEIASLGFALHRDDLWNPSGGLVRIPAHALAGAAQVAVQTRPGAGIHRFRVDGLTQALEAARNAGCGPEAFVN
jgi:hypothetical protein